MKSGNGKSQYDRFETSGYLDGNSAAYVDSLYEMFLQDPNSVSAQWQVYFDSLREQSSNPEYSHAEIRRSFAKMASQPAQVMLPNVVEKQANVDSYIEAFRSYATFPRMSTRWKQVLLTSD